jgi:hypothetical protein
MKLCDLHEENENHSKRDYEREIIKLKQEAEELKQQK